MSKTAITLERVNSVESHPNADRLEVVQVLGYKVCTGKGNFQVGDLAVYFPPDILLPQNHSDDLGVTNYLKHAVLPGATEKTQCRVGAARLRGVASHGFVVPAGEAGIRIDSSLGYGFDVTHLFDAHKYVPPVREGAGDAEPEIPTFHGYTSIENIQRYPGVFMEGEPVVITEKIHGTNCRLGLVRDGDEMIFVAGSHHVRRKPGSGLYWNAMTEEVKALLMWLSGYQRKSVVLFGEIFGTGVQDMDYGMTEKSFRAFDISLDGKYVAHDFMLERCTDANIPVVPELYRGEFSHEVVEEHTYGNTTFKGVKSKFKGREGCVIKPLAESHCDILGGRKILKSVSADYRDRKGAKDIE